jgi:hypothetical protein
MGLFCCIAGAGHFFLKAVGWGLPRPRNFQERYWETWRRFPPHIDRKVVWRYRLAMGVIAFVAVLIISKYGFRR